MAKERNIESADEFFHWFENEWASIARHLTAAYSVARKAELKLSLEKNHLDIEAHIKRCAAIPNEQQANQWRHLDYFIRSIISELSMWLNLSRNNGAGAWDNFCSAESIAARTAYWLPEMKLAQDRLVHLSEVERVVFPHQPYFTSSGLVISKETCSICGQEYGNCGHVAGEVYNGTVAYRRIDKIERVLHLAFVEHPADKSCRFMEFEGIDPLTGEPPHQNVAPSQSNQIRPKRQKKKRNKR